MLLPTVALACANGRPSLNDVGFSLGFAALPYGLALALPLVLAAVARRRLERTIHLALAIVLSLTGVYLDGWWVNHATGGDGLEVIGAALIPVYTIPLAPMIAVLLLLLRAVAKYFHTRRYPT